MTVRQSDITRALRAARAAGQEAERIEISEGHVVVYLRDGERVEPQDAAKAWIEANR